MLMARRRRKARRLRGSARNGWIINPAVGVHPVKELLLQAQLQLGCKSPPTVTQIDEIDCPYSHISRLTLECDGRSRIAYLKRPKMAGIVDEAAKRRIIAEYQILERFSEQFAAHPQFSVVRPIAVFPDQLAVLMEAAPGISLMKLLGRGAKWYSRGQSKMLERYCSLSGQWLREFQSSTRREGEQLNLKRLVGYCDARFDVLIAGRCAGIDQAFKARYEAGLRKRYQASKAEVDVIVGCHHDFSPHNIFVSADRVCVIDFGQFDHDSHLYDACRFWFQLECMKSSPFYRRSTIERLQDAFFSGYQMPVDPRHPAFELIVSAYFLSRLATLTRNGLRRGPRGWVDRSLYRSCLRWIEERCS
jgi:hypothetical protein